MGSKKCAVMCFLLKNVHLPCVMFQLPTTTFYFKYYSQYICLSLGFSDHSKIFCVQCPISTFNNFGNLSEFRYIAKININKLLYYRNSLQHTPELMSNIVYFLITLKTKMFTPNILFLNRNFSCNVTLLIANIVCYLCQLIREV